MNESALIDALRNDSRAAFRELYEMYFRKLFSFCFQYTKSRENAEEITEDVFVWLWQNRNDIKPQETLKHLIFLRTRHFLINFYRATVNSPIYVDYLEYCNSISYNDVMQKLDYDSMRAKVNEVIASLPQTQQNVIMLSKFECLKNKEISIKLGLSEQTVKNQLSVGLHTLRKKLGLPLFIVMLLVLK